MKQTRRFYKCIENKGFSRNACFMEMGLFTFFAVQISERRKLQSV